MKLFPLGRKSLPRTCHNPHPRPKPAQKSGVWVRPTTGHTGVVDLKSGFNQGPIPRPPPIRPTNMAKEPMARSLLRPPPLVITFHWREWGRRRRQRWGAHPHQTSRGDFRTTLTTNAGLCWPTRPSDAPVGRQEAITPTAGATGAPMSRLCDQWQNTGLWIGGRERVENRRGAKGRRQRRREPSCRCWRQREKIYSKQTWI